MPPYTSINADSKNKAMANSSTSPLRSSLHITSHFLVVQSSLVISEVLKKYILKCRSIAPQQVCYILVMKSERDCVGQNQDFVETIDVVEGVISVLDFLQALSNNDFRPEDLNSLPLSSFSHTSYLEFEWLHHEKDPQGFDLLDLYEVNGHHLGTIDPRRARWHIAEDRERAMSEAWSQSDLADVLMQQQACFDFLHTFSKCVRFVRSDETVKNVINTMTSEEHHCLVAVLEPFENDVVGICRPIDILARVFERQGRFPRTILECTYKAIGKSRAERFSWLFQVAPQEIRKWFERTRFPATVPLFQCLERISANLVSPQMYFSCSRTLLALSPRAKEVWSHLEVLSDSIPDIPIPTFYRQATHNLLMGVAPNLRLVVDSRKWHLGDRQIAPQNPISDDSDDWDICSVSSTDSSPNGYSSNCLSQTDAATTMFAVILLAGGLYVVTGGAASVRSGLECFVGAAFGSFSRDSFRAPNTPYTRNCLKPSKQFTSRWTWRGISPIPRWLSPVLTPNPRLSPRLGHSMILSSSQQGAQNHSFSSIGCTDSQVCHQESRYLKQTAAPSNNADLIAGGVRRMKFMSSSSALYGSGISTGSDLNQTPSSNNTSTALGLGMQTTYYASPIVSIAAEYRERLQPIEQERQHLGRFDYAPIHAPNSVGPVPKRLTDPFIFAVPKTFQFRLHFLGPSSETVYKLQDAETSTAGYRTLMEQIKKYLAEAGVASLLAEFKSAYAKPKDGEEEDGQLEPTPSRTNQHFFIAAYTGFSGEDTVLNPWDMVYAVQIAMVCRESVVNIRLRQFCGTEMDFGELVPSGCRLLRFQPFSQKSRLLDMGLKD